MNEAASFDGEMGSVPEARAWVAGVIGDRPRRLVDDVLLCVSELTSNAVRHARSDFTVLVADHGRGVRIEVHDTSGSFPVLQPVVPEATNGRGIQIVDAIVDRWGVLPRPDGGKTVWCELGATS
jgi:anti-sigma regulatory factor (Ser/Thr protein kinase)